MVSPRSYFVFTPLLASTTVGTLEFRAISESVRRLGKHVTFYQGWADDVDFARKVIRVEENTAEDFVSQTGLSIPLPPKDGQTDAPAVQPKGNVDEVPYDKLVIAVGSYSQTFGIEGVRQYASFLRDIGDARKIRLSVLARFEQCTSPHIRKSSSHTGTNTDLSTHEANPPSPADQVRRKLLHFAIVGGGPTGIEFAAELHDLINEDLRKIYPALMPYVSITVYDVAPKILPMFEQTLADYAMRMFARQHITVKTGHSIQRVRPDPDGCGGLSLKIAEYGEEEVGAGLVVWSTGLMQNPLVEKLVQKSVLGNGGSLRLEKDPKTGGIIVDDRFRASLSNGHKSRSSPTSDNADEDSSNIGNGNHKLLLDDVFVIGDCAVIDSQPALPKTAQVASQEAVFLAKALNRHHGEDSLADAKPFRFRNLGTMTYLGGWRAIHQSKADRLTGWVAWVLWRTAYLTKSMSLRNKVLVPVYVSFFLPLHPEDRELWMT